MNENFFEAHLTSCYEFDQFVPFKLLSGKTKYFEMIGEVNLKGAIRQMRTCIEAFQDS